MNRRWLWLGALAIVIMVLLTLVAAPGTGRAISSGSTYSRAPDGYGAWYAFMEKQGTPVKRWEKPFTDLPGVSAGESGVRNKNPLTLLRVNSQNRHVGLDSQAENWVKQGNTLAMLGVEELVTEAAFITMQESASGRVMIRTARRRSQLQQGEKQLLGDRFGAVVWQQQLGEGQLIFATTPHLAANAYQDEPGTINSSPS